MDGPRLSLAGRVVLALVLLALPWSGGSRQLGTTGAPPAQPAVQAIPQPPHGLLHGQVPLVRAAARLGRPSRRGDALVAVLAAALAGTVVAATRQFQLDGLADRYRLTAFNNRGAGGTAMPKGPSPRR